MGDLGLHPPCCLANGLTEGEHDSDCDDHPVNRQRRLRRYLAHYPDLIRRAEAS